MLLGQLHHVELYVSNLERTLQFWGWFLESIGYQRFQQWDSGVSWKLDETYLVFVQVQERYKEMPYHRCATGLNHLAFHGKSQQHIDEVTIELKKRGIRVLYEDRHPHASGRDSYAVFFEDPDQLKVELVAP